MQDLLIATRILGYGKDLSEKVDIVGMMFTTCQFGFAVLHSIESQISIKKKMKNMRMLKVGEKGRNL
jgi:hypothetical protein